MSEDTVSLETKLREKLANGEITQEEYDKLMEKFGNLDLLSSRVDSEKTRHKSSHTHWSPMGKSTIEGGEYEKPISISGKLVATGPIKCPSMRISGSALVDGDLTVVDSTKISGTLSIAEGAKFGGPFSLSGKVEIGGDTYFTDTVKISGKIGIRGNVVAGKPIKISGKLNSNSLRSTSSMKLSGKVNINEDLLAEEFITSGGGSYIGGSLKATTVEIARKYRERQSSDEYDVTEDASNLEDIPDLGHFITNIVTKFVPQVLMKTIGGNGGPPSTFMVDGNIEGKIIDISYTHVKGDLIADIVKIGPGVIIEGKIIYRESIILPEGSTYQTEQIHD